MMPGEDMSDEIGTFSVLVVGEADMLECVKDSTDNSISAASKETYTKTYISVTALGPSKANDISAMCKVFSFPNYKSIFKIWICIIFQRKMLPIYCVPLPILFMNLGYKLFAV